ncbi:MAG TPA: methyl-accepting chemotaxis protein [Terriglobia bacterium]|nr:methyl-accepting chemotaxis protein [Terriglobia bacterium]
MRIPLRNKIYGLALVAAILPVLVLLLLLMHFRSSVSHEAAREMASLAEANVDQATKDAYGLCETTNNLLQGRVGHNLSVARRILAQEGGVSTSTEMVHWLAVNQLSQSTTPIALPRMLIAGAPATQNRSFKVTAPFLDEITRLVGSKTTIFQRMNETGDMLRVATSVPASDGNRGIGTYIPAVAPDGTPSPVVTAVLRGEVYRGTAFVVNDRYVAAYDPLRDRGGKIIGMLFVGEKISEVGSVRSTLLNTVIGRTGYIVVIGAKGNQRGRYIISKGGMRDGEDLWEQRDSNGTLFVQEMVQQALASGKGELFHRSYVWQNPGEPKARLKHSALIYFGPWDWLIVAGAYEDEYMGAIEGVKLSATHLLWSVIFAGFLSLLVALGIAFVMGRRLTKPVEMVTRLAGKVAKGDLHSAREQFFNLPAATNGHSLRWFDFPDESVDLMSSFQEMTQTLGSLIGQVQRAGIQVTSSTTEITASAKQLEPAVTEQAAATREVSATSSQISATSRDLLRTMSDAGEAALDVAAQAESGQSKLNEMESAIRELVKATGSISSRLGIISDRASKISTVVTTINKISDQTALLSLNAAIEAEKAGEFGKGFSVVAREISRLADQTAVATQDIDSVVKEMQSSVSSGVMEMDKFSEEVRQRVAEVNGIAAALGKMIENVQALGPEFETAKQGMQGQTQAAEQINEAMKQLAQTADLTKSLLGEFQKITAQLNSAVQELQGGVSRFRTAA